MTTQDLREWVIRWNNIPGKTLEDFAYQKYYPNGEPEWLKNCVRWQEGGVTSVAIWRFVGSNRGEVLFGINDYGKAYIKVRDYKKAAAMLPEDSFPTVIRMLASLTPAMVNPAVFVDL